MSIISKASAKWQGSLKTGTGNMKPAHASDVAFGLGSRFEGAPGSNPEEMIGAALAGCFSMALSGALGRANLTPESIDTNAVVSMDKDASGFAISKIELTTVVKVAGLDNEQFQTIAAETKKGCPVSRALAATNITLTASLA